MTWTRAHTFSPSRATSLENPIVTAHEVNRGSSALSLRSFPVNWGGGASTVDDLNQFWQPIPDLAAGLADDVYEDDSEAEDALEVLEYIESPLTPDTVTEVERRLGYRLPEAYLEVMRVQNGGVPQNRACRIEETVDEMDCAWVEGFFGVGWTKSSSLCSAGEFWKSAHGFPELGVYFALVTMDGPRVLALDYRACGPEGEPAVVCVQTNYVEGEGNCPRVTAVAPDFQAFLKLLEPEDVYFEAQDRWLAANTHVEIVQKGGVEDEPVPEFVLDAELQAKLDTLAQLYARRPEVYDSPEAAAEYGQWLSSLMTNPELSHRLWRVIQDHAAFLPAPLVGEVLMTSWLHVGPGTDEELSTDEEPSTEDMWRELQLVPLKAAELVVRQLEELAVLGNDAKPAFKEVATATVERWFSAGEVAKRRRPLSEQNRDWVAKWYDSEFVRVPDSQAATIALHLVDSPPEFLDERFKWLGALRHLLLGYPMDWSVRARVLERLVGDVARPTYGFDRLTLHLLERGELPVSVLGGLRRLFVDRPPAIPWPVNLYTTSPELNPGEPWAGTMLERLAHLEAEDRARWGALFEHASQVIRVDERTDQEWRQHGTDLMHGIGQTNVLEMLEGVDNVQPFQRERPWLDTGDGEPDLYNTSVQDGLRELYWSFTAQP